MLLTHVHGGDSSCICRGTRRGKQTLKHTRGEEGSGEEGKEEEEEERLDRVAKGGGGHHI